MRMDRRGNRVVKTLKDELIVGASQNLLGDIPISSATRRQIESSIRNMKMGKAGSPVDIRTARRTLRS